MRIELVLSLLGAAWLASAAPAARAEGPNICAGVEWDEQRALAVARVTAPSRAYLLKNSSDDPSAAACPAKIRACRQKAYLVAGDLVLVGRTQGDFACVAYQSPKAIKPVWVSGWLPRAALRPAAESSSPDWIGAWRHPGGHIEIGESIGGKSRIEGSMTLPTPSGDFQNGDFQAQIALPTGPALRFTDQGVYGDLCHVRMQRVGALLLVEDNGGCGGAGVTFTGLYRRR
jgi:hypothetical protein